MNKSLHFQKHQVANPSFQTEFLAKETALPTFETKLSEVGLFPLQATQLETLQLNLGKMCNQTCTHCHVDAGPDRKEIMTQETMLDILKVIKNNNFKLIDLTGGAPEMNPHFRWFVEQIREINSGIRIIVRSNLTIIVSNQKYNDLPQFFKKHGIEVVSSLPSTDSIKTDSQRGKGVFEQSIKALKLLNEAGYGKADGSLQLSLVYNPSDAFLAMPQSVLEKDFKKSLRSNHQIDFNNLLTINNLPISRFLNHLLITNQYEAYMQQLVDAFNPQAAQNVMCRTMLSVGWDGYLYDCDFNQMLEMKVAGSAQHISQFNAEELGKRTIKINQHCFGCTAGGGSSCSGEIVKSEGTCSETKNNICGKRIETPVANSCCSK